MRRQSGDTLVEVMIAVAIIGSVIAIAYSTASRSLKVGRYAQERTEALKLAEGQLETLKAYAPTVSQIYTTDTTTAPGQSFCMSGASVVLQRVLPADLFADPLKSNATPTTAEPYHTSCSLGTDSRYKLSITRTDTGAGTTEKNTFTIKARWDRIGGGKDEVVLHYKLHERLYN